MAIILSPLPYAAAALEPHISAETIKLHHGKHHSGYVDKVNRLAKEAGLATASLEEIIAAARKSEDQKLFNQAAQAWNHGFYWPSLATDKNRPSTKLAKAIELSFGSQAALDKQWITAATDHFGSGWAWLMLSKGELAIKTTHDAETLAGGSDIPLAVIDVWEHAYYLDHQNKRHAYVEAAVSQFLNWDFASENFARREPWSYPIC
jgi:superoxide dismutase, Fe-Mn family